jgi:hypothetical protein
LNYIFKIYQNNFLCTVILRHSLLFFLDVEKVRKV